MQGLLQGAECALESGSGCRCRDFYGNVHFGTWMLAPLQLLRLQDAAARRLWLFAFLQNIVQPTRTLDDTHKSRRCQCSSVSFCLA